MVTLDADAVLILFCFYMIMAGVVVASGDNDVGTWTQYLGFLIVAFVLTQILVVLMRVAEILEGAIANL